MQGGSRADLNFKGSKTKIVRQLIDEVGEVPFGPGKKFRGGVSISPGPSRREDCNGNSVCLSKSEGIDNHVNQIQKSLKVYNDEPDQKEPHSSKIQDCNPADVLLDLNMMFGQ